MHVRVRQINRDCREVIFLLLYSGPVWRQCAHPNKRKLCTIVRNVKAKYVPCEKHAFVLLWKAPYRHGRTAQHYMQNFQITSPIIFKNLFLHPMSVALSLQFIKIFCVEILGLPLMKSAVLPNCTLYSTASTYMYIEGSGNLHIYRVRGSHTFIKATTTISYIQRNTLRCNQVDTEMKRDANTHFVCIITKKLCLVHVKLLNLHLPTLRTVDLKHYIYGAMFAFNAWHYIN